MIRSCHNLLIFPRFALTPASFNKSTQATSKQRVGSSSLPGRAISFERVLLAPCHTLALGASVASESIFVDKQLLKLASTNLRNSSMGFSVSVVLIRISAGRGNYQSNVVINEGAVERRELFF